MKNFLQQIFASLIGTLAAIALSLTLGASGLLLLVLLLGQQSEPLVEDKTMVVMDLSSSIQDTEPILSLTEALSRDPGVVMPLRSVLETIRKAAQDDRIVALVLDARRGGNAFNGYATLADVRDALSDFQKSGKKIIAYGVNWDEKSYYLAAIADEVVISPLGNLELNGFGLQPVFFAGALEKYGIGIQTVRVGNYKSAIEPFTRQDLSPESRQQTEQLLGNLWSRYLGRLAQGRELTPQSLQAIADNRGLVLASVAKQQGLIDKIAYWDETLKTLESLGVAKDSTPKEGDDPDRLRQISLNSYRDVSVKAKPRRQSKNKIALVYLSGAIVEGRGTLDNVGSERFALILRGLLSDDQVKAIVLRINSPGGSATASDTILRETQRLQAQKPVVVSMGNVAASGGYWIATGGQRLFADPMTVTGSIGVFSLFFNLEKLGNNLGLTWDQVETAKLSNLGSTITPKSEVELTIFQGAVNQVYDVFLDKVAKSRNLPKSKVAEIAQGRVWSGVDAQRLGLVDELGGMEAAITYAAQQAKLGDDWQVQEYPGKKSLEEVLAERFLNTQLATMLKPEAIDNGWGQPWKKIKRELEPLQSFNDPQGVYSRSPLFWDSSNW